MKIPKNDKSEPAFDMEEVKNSLIIENDFLTKLVDTIPAKMYFDYEIQERITAEKHLNTDRAVEALKRNSNHLELSAKGKHKRARLDPFSQKSVSQIHDELKKNKKKKKKNKSDFHNPSTALTRAANIEELQRRLHERIELLQAKRKATQFNPESKRAQKRKLKKLKKQKGNLLKAQAEAAVVKVDKQPEKKKSNKSSEKPVFNKEGNFLFSKFDFSTEDGQRDSKKSEYAGKKTKVLLKKAEEKKEKLEALKKADPQKAELVVEKEKWKKAIQKTEGLKVKDDPNLLKKSVKREEKKKKKSAKLWKERTEENEKKKQARQEKRSQNIQQKKKERKDRKLKLLKKKGRVITKM